MGCKKLKKQKKTVDNLEKVVYIKYRSIEHYEIEHEDMCV